MENPRTETARDNDDSELIDNIVPAPSEEGRSGGDLARNVATQAELDAIGDPEAHRGVEKQDAIDEDQARRTNRPRD